MIDERYDGMWDTGHWFEMFYKGVAYNTSKTGRHTKWVNEGDSYMDVRSPSAETLIVPKEFL